MNKEITESQKKFNDVAKQRHLNMENLVLTTLLLCADNGNKQPSTDEEKSNKKGEGEKTIE